MISFSYVTIWCRSVNQNRLAQSWLHNRERERKRKREKKRERKRESTIVQPTCLTGELIASLQKTSYHCRLTKWLRRRRKRRKKKKKGEKEKAKEEDHCRTIQTHTYIYSLTNDRLLWSGRRDGKQRRGETKSSGRVTAVFCLLYNVDRTHTHTLYTRFTPHIFFAV